GTAPGSVEPATAAAWSRPGGARVGALGSMPMAAVWACARWLTIVGRDASVPSHGSADPLTASAAAAAGKPAAPCPVRLVAQGGLVVKGDLGDAAFTQGTAGGALRGLRAIQTPAP